MSQHNDSQPKKPDPVVEDHSGVFGFFRKYQKAILYSAGLFTLLTFSITGALMGWTDNLFKDKTAQPTIVVNGKTYDVDEEDRQIGMQLARGSVRVPVLPDLVEDQTRGNDLQTILAVLRRASLAEGLDVSMDEVDRAIQFVCDAYSKDAAEKWTPKKLAAQAVGSLAAFRMLVKESMRIGNYVRLQALDVDTTDAAVMQSLLKDTEKITLRDASFDAKALQEELKKNGKLSEEDLRKFLDGKDDMWKQMQQVYDTNHVSLQLGVCDLASFDPAPWAEELKDLDLSDDTLQKLYDQIKDPAFKIDPAEWQKDPKNQGPAPEFLSFNEESTKELLKKRAQAQKVMDGLLIKLREQRNESLKPTNDALTAANNARNEALKAVEAAKAKLADKPDDEALKQAVTDAQAAFEAKKTEAEAAEKALGTAREGFDFAKAFTDLTHDAEGKPRPGFAIKEVPGLKNAEELKTLPDGLGTWNMPTLATSLMQNGELGSMVGATDKALFVFKATELVLKPMKAWDKLKDKLEDEYYLEQSQEQTKLKKEAFAKALLDLAKGKIPDKVAELEGKKQARIAEEFANFDAEKQARIKEATEVLETRLKGMEYSMAWQEWKKALDTATAELGKKEEHQQEIEKKVQKEIDDQVAVEAKKHYGEVLDEAAQQAGFTVTKIGPLDRNLTRLPRAKQRFDDSTYFLFSNPAKDLKVGECTDLIEDFASRKWHLAVCDKVEPRTEADVTRREFLTARDGLPSGFATFQATRMAMALSQSFGLDALKARYQYEIPGAAAENKAQ